LDVIKFLNLLTDNRIKTQSVAEWLKWGCSEEIWTWLNIKWLKWGWNEEIWTLGEVGQKWAKPNFKCIRPIRFRFLLSSPSSSNQHATHLLSSLLLSSLFFSCCPWFSPRALRHRHPSRRHEQPRKFQFTPTLLWRLTVKSLPFSAILAPWPILNNTLEHKDNNWPEVWDCCERNFSSNVDFTLAVALDLDDSHLYYWFRK